MVEKMRQTFVRTPQKSNKQASLELNVPKTTAWKMLITIALQGIQITVGTSFELW
jgi:hypothetical protein